MGREPKGGGGCAGAGAVPAGRTVPCAGRLVVTAGREGESYVVIPAAGYNLTTYALRSRECSAIQSRPDDTERPMDIP